MLFRVNGCFYVKYCFLLNHFRLIIVPCRVYVHFYLFIFIFIFGPFTLNVMLLSLFGSYVLISFYLLFGPKPISLKHMTKPYKLTPTQQARPKTFSTFTACSAYRPKWPVTLTVTLSSPLAISCYAVPHIGPLTLLATSHAPYRPSPHLHLHPTFMPIRPFSFMHSRPLPLFYEHTNSNP